MTDWDKLDDLQRFKRLASIQPLPTINKDVLAILNRILDQNAQILKALELPPPVIPDAEAGPGNWRHPSIMLDFDFECQACHAGISKAESEIRVTSRSAIVSGYCPRCKQWNTRVYGMADDNG